MGVSKNNGTPKSSILIGFSHYKPSILGGFPVIFGNTQMMFPCFYPQVFGRQQPVFQNLRDVSSRLKLEVGGDFIICNSWYNPTFVQQPHSIHGTNGIFTYIYHKKTWTIHVGKYTVIYHTWYGNPMIDKQKLCQ